MHIRSLSTAPFQLTGAQYQQAWICYNLRRRAWLCAALGVAVVVVGVCDVRIAISAAMLAAVVMPMAALLVWSRILRDAAGAHVVEPQRIEVSDDALTSYSPADDEQGLAERMLFTGAVAGVAQSSSYVIVTLRGVAAPLFIPRSAVGSIAVAPPPVETFD